MIPNVYISLTSIPTREKILRKCLDALMKQKYPIKRILITIPQKSLRSGECFDVPSYLYDSPYKDIVTVIRPKKDYGPISKYIGGYKYIDKNSVVFVCDDDQRYHPNLVGKLVDRYNKLEHNKKDRTVITSLGEKLLTTHIVYGFASLLLPSKVIDIIRNSVMKSSNHVKTSCQFVDDHWVSIMLKKNSIKVINMNIPPKQRYIDGKIYNPSDGLCSNTDRWSDVIKCTCAIDLENTYPIIALILVVLFVLFIIIYYYEYDNPIVVLVVTGLFVLFIITVFGQK